jgi:uncharacterized protein YqfB (UPF0267 family)
MVTNENHYFCTILKGSIIFFFNGLSKIHRCQMNLSVKDQRQIIIPKDIKSGKFKFCQVQHYLYKKK